MAWRCYISNFRSLGCQEAHQEGPYPPSPRMGRTFVKLFNLELIRELLPIFSRDSDLRNSSRDGDMLQRDVDMYEHIHISFQHIHK